MAQSRSRRTAARAHAQPAQARRQPERDLAESPLAWLMRRKMLTEIEFDAGEKLRGDFWFAEMTPRVTANWGLLLSGGGGSRGSPDLGPDLRDNVIAARERVRRALSAVGPDLAGVLIDVCCHLKGLEASERACGWPQRSGKVILRIALGQLARHYGMHPPAGAQEDRRVRISHWGTDDYRPRLDVEAEPAAE